MGKEAASKFDCVQFMRKARARIELDQALARVMTSILQDDTQLFKEFQDDDSFRKWLSEKVFALTYEPGG